MTPSQSPQSAKYFHFVILSIAISFVAVVAAYQSYRLSSSNVEALKRHRWRHSGRRDNPTSCPEVGVDHATTTARYSWINELKVGLDETASIVSPKSFCPEDEASKSVGRVTRTAAKSFEADSSTPTSPSYTTRKNPRGQITLYPSGVEGDYNHYRTNVLKGTPDRAVSILTSDVMSIVRSKFHDRVSEGDLGENILVDRVPFTFFEPEKRYMFVSSQREEGVIVEITERIEPCANVCRLPFINDEDFSPLERIQKCKDFLSFLDRASGMRGWYGKVIGEGGVIRVGDSVMAL